MKVRQVKESGRYGSSNPDTMSPGNYDRYQQDQMDYGKREFKRREMEHELGHEDEQQRREQSGTYYIRINGRLLKNKEGQPYQFRGKEAANKAAVTMMSKPFNRDKKFTLTTTASDRQDNPTPESSIAEMDGAPGQILAATGDKVTIDNKDGTQTVAPKASLTRDPTGKGFVLSKTPTPGGEKPDEPKPGETVFQPATTEGIEKMNEAIRMLRLAGLHKAADRLMEQQLFENPYQGADAAKFAAMSPEDQAWLTKGGGKPDINDQYILMRAPNKGKAVAAPAAAAPAAAAPAAAAPAAAAPAAAALTRGSAAAAPVAQDDATGVDAAVAAQAAKPATATAPQTGAASNMAKDPSQQAQAAKAPQKVDPNQADRDDAEMGAAMTANAQAAELARIKQLAGAPTAAAGTPPPPASAGAPKMTAADQDDADMGAAMTANAQAANGVNTAGQNVTMPDGTNPESGEKTSTQAASPAAPAGAAKAPAKSDPKVMAMQQELIKKGANIKADGIMGQQTIAAQKQFGTPGTDLTGRRTAATDPRVSAPSTAGAGRGGQGGPTAAQAAPRPGVNRPAAGGQAASPAAPAAPVDPTKMSVAQRMATQPSLIDQGRAKLGIPAGGTKSEDRQFYEELDKMLTIARLR